MIVNIHPSKFEGSCAAPPSKSYMQRAVAIAALCNGISEIKNPSLSEDGLAALNIAKALGRFVTKSQNQLNISGDLKLRNSKWNIGESGLSARMFSAIASIFDSEIEIIGSGSIHNRPMMMIKETLEQLGARVQMENRYLPIKITGPISPSSIHIDGSETSQLLTGLLIALPLLKGDSKIEVENLNSKPYVDITLEIIKDFGVNIEHDNYRQFFIKGNQQYKPKSYNIEGDWSGASFILVGGAIKGSVEVSNLNLASPQADRAILEALKLAGSSIKIDNNTVTVTCNRLEAFEFDATDCPDLFPPLVALCANCNGPSKIKGIHRLQYKESNRYLTLQQEFSKLGVKIDAENDFMHIQGGIIHAAETSACEDHRIAMALAIAGLNADGIISINQFESIQKSYPSFLDDFASLGGKFSVKKV